MTRYPQALRKQATDNARLGIDLVDGSYYGTISMVNNSFAQAKLIEAIKTICAGMLDKVTLI